MEFLVRVCMRLAEFFASFSKTPWSCFETMGIVDGKQVMFTMRWNSTFVKALRDQGFAAETEEEIIHMFWILTKIEGGGALTDKTHADAVNDMVGVDVESGNRLVQ